MDMLQLSNQVCFPVYALSRKITAHYQPLLEKLDVTYPQYLVLLLLWEHKRLSVKALGDHLMLDSGTLTPLLKRLEEKGLVRRERSRADERVVEISLSETGRALKRKAAEIPGKLLCSMNLSENELIHLRQTVIDALNKMTEALEKQNQ